MRIPVSARTGSPVSADVALSRPAGDPDRAGFLLRMAGGLIAALEDGSDEALSAACTEDVEVRILVDEDGQVWGGDFEPVYSGIAGLRQSFEQWRAPWEDIRLEVNELVDLGGDQVIVIGTWHGRGRGSGIEITDDYPAKYTLRGDRIAVIEFIDLEQTLKELGL